MEKTSNHTPGPWVATCNHISGDLTTVDGTHVYPTIALVDTATTAADANARLIAAAPELLQQLEIVLGYAISYAATARGETQEDVKKYPWATRAQQALAKAKGENQ